MGENIKLDQKEIGCDGEGAPKAWAAGLQRSPQIEIKKTHIL
jgi:hypothetical protein